MLAEVKKVNKSSLVDIFNKELKRVLLIIVIILFLIVVVVLATAYRSVYLNQQQRVENSIKDFVRDTSEFVSRQEQIYNRQLKKNLLDFYSGYNSSQDKEYIATQMEQIKSKIKSFDSGKELKVEEINYYLINQQGKIYDTDYNRDKGLDLSQEDEFWFKLKALEEGEVLLLPFDNETLTSKMRLYAYLKLPDDNYFELGISFNNLQGLLNQRLTSINQDSNLELKLFTYDFDSLFNSNWELSAAEKDFLLQSKEGGELVAIEDSIFSETYYQSFSSEYGDLYAVLDLDYKSLRLFLNLIIVVLIFVLVVIYLTSRRLEDKIENIITPIQAIAQDMNDFNQGKEVDFDLEETGIKEFDNIISNYKQMAIEVSASYQQLEAYSEELETTNHQLTSNKRKLRKIIDLSPNHIFIKDKGGKYILVNKTHANFFSKTVEEFVELTEQELHQLDDSEVGKFLADDRAVINSHQKQVVEDQVTDEDGNKIIFETVKIPFDEGDETYVLAIARDITEERKAENRIKDQKQELEASYQQLEAYNQEILELNQNLKSAYQERDQLVKKLEKVISLTSELTRGSLTDKREFLSQLLQSAFEIIEEADYGSVYLFGEEKVEFVDTIGHDLDLLQSLNISNRAFKSNPTEPEIIANIMNKTKLNLVQAKKDKFMEATKPLKETIVFALAIDDTKEAGFSLDIADDSKEKFSQQSLEIIEAFNNLAISFYIMQDYNSMQQNFQKQIVSSLINMLEVHDQYTKGHSENVAHLATKIAFELGLSIEDINDTYWAGMLHDIGKTVIPKEILNKAGKLSYEEYQKIKQHPVWGYRALKDAEQLQEIAVYIHHHHERPDGSGYPEGLIEQNTPLVSQILAVADAWDAMRSTRSYRAPLSKAEAKQELIDNMGNQFSQKVVQAFLSILDK
jgi:PAS domain S-box-containing protein